jgi:hypothetical protein
LTLFTCGAWKEKASCQSLRLVIISSAQPAEALGAVHTLYTRVGVAEGATKFPRVRVAI